MPDPYKSTTYQRRRLALALMGFVRGLRLARTAAPPTATHEYSSSDAWGLRVRLSTATGAVSTQDAVAPLRGGYHLDPEFARFLEQLVAGVGPQLISLNAGNPRAVPAAELARVLGGLNELGWRQRTRWHGVGYVINNRAVEAQVWPIGGTITAREVYKPPPPLFVTTRHGMVWRLAWSTGAGFPSVTAVFAPSIRRAALWHGTARARRRRP